MAVKWISLCTSVLLVVSLTGVEGWISATTYGVKCRTDSDCVISEADLVCAALEPKTCRCRRKLEWDTISKRCYLMEEEAYRNHGWFTAAKFDPVKDLIIPGIIVMTVAAMVYLGFKLFCNCGKLWRRRRRRLEMPREMEENNLQQHQLQQQHQQQQPTWVASYRVFSSVNGLDPRSPAALSPTGPHGFSMHPTTCMGLFLPSSHLAATVSPPPYEEALKHKVIMSSYPGAVIMQHHGGESSLPPHHDQQ